MKVIIGCITTFLTLSSLGCGEVIATANPSPLVKNHGHCSEYGTHIKQQMASRHDEITKCYNDRLEPNRRLPSGKVSSQSTIRWDGTVEKTKTKVAMSSMYGQEVEACLINVINNITYPKMPHPTRIHQCIVKFPFSFQRVDD